MSLFDDVSGGSSWSDTNGLIYGVVTGTVKENYDKDNPGKVKVELFLGEEGKNVTGWIPVMTPYAGKNYGEYTLPEIGDEVVVAFNMGDRNYPIVIGSLWSTTNAIPADTVTEKNLTKRFITKGKNVVFIDDTENKCKIKLETANGKGALFDEENDKIEIYDKEKKNSITIDSKGGVITIKADKKIVLNAGNADMGTFDGTGKKITLETTSIEAKAQKDAKISGQQGVTVEGAQIEIKANATIKAQATGITEIKGAMVKING